MTRWSGAAIVIAILTVVILVVGPSWLLTACDSPDPGIQDCGLVSSFFVGFVGAFFSAFRMLIAVVRKSR